MMIGIMKWMRKIMLMMKINLLSLSYGKSLDKIPQIYFRQ